jgi:hypothetical protein
VFQSFFEELWAFLSLSEIVNYIKGILHDREDWSMKPWLKLAAFITLQLFFTAILLLSLFLIDTEKVAYISYILGVYLLFMPAFAIGKVLVFSWKSLLFARRLLPDPPSEGSMDLDNEEAKEHRREASEESEPVKILSPFDPCQLSSQPKWKNIIFSDINVLGWMQRSKFGSELIPLTLFGLSILAIGALDIYRQVLTDQWSEEQKQYMASLLEIMGLTEQPDVRTSLQAPWLSVIEIIARFLFFAFCLPYLMYSNITVLFFHWSHIKKHRHISIMKMIGVGIVVVGILCTIAGAALRANIGGKKSPEPRTLFLDPVKLMVIPTIYD